MPKLTKRKTGDTFIFTTSKAMGKRIREHCAKTGQPIGPWIRSVVAREVSPNLPRDRPEVILLDALKSIAESDKAIRHVAEFMDSKIARTAIADYEKAMTSSRSWSYNDQWKAEIYKTVAEDVTPEREFVTISKETLHEKPMVKIQFE